MAASDEWEEKHLTPNGWVRGSYKHDFGQGETVTVPADAVLTVRRHVVIGAIGARPNVNEGKTPLIADKARIAELLQQYGEPTFSC